MQVVRRPIGWSPFFSGSLGPCLKPSKVLSECKPWGRPRPAGLVLQRRVRPPQAPIKLTIFESLIRSAAGVGGLHCAVPRCCVLCALESSRTQRGLVPVWMSVMRGFGLFQCMRDCAMCIAAAVLCVLRPHRASTTCMWEGVQLNVCRDVSLVGDCRGGWRVPSSVAGAAVCARRKMFG